MVGVTSDGKTVSAQLQLPHNIDVEMTVIGLVVNASTKNRARAWQDFCVLQSEDFFDPLHQSIWNAVRRLHDAGKHVDLATVWGETCAEYDGVESRMALDYKHHLINCVASIVTWVNNPAYAALLRDLAEKRRMIENCMMFAQRASTEGFTSSAADLAGEAIADLQAKVSGHRDLIGPTTIIASMQARIDKPVAATATGLPRLDAALRGGFHEHKFYGVGADQKAGKAQPMNARVLTLAGWKRMGEMQVGDAVASPDGRESIVTGVFPRGVMPVYRVTFSDGRSTECSGDHLWNVNNFRKNEAWETVDTIELQRRTSFVRGCYVPDFCGQFGSDDSLSLHPYLMGALLGDGSLTNGCPIISTADDELLAAVVAVIPTGYIAKHISRYDYRLVRKDRFDGGWLCPNAITKHLEFLMLRGCRSHEKFIPDPYLTATFEARMNLIRGLMDTDGWVQKGRPGFVTTSKQLANDMVTLIRSIGGQARITERNPSYVYKGERVQGKTAYRVLIRYQRPQDLFKLSRKKEIAHAETKHCGRLVVKSVEYLRNDEVQCISVSHPDGLYVTDDFIVTHNTTMMAATMSYNMALRGEPHVYICLEMDPEQIFQRYLARWMAEQSGADTNTDIFYDRKQTDSDWFREDLRKACEVFDEKHSGLWFLQRPRMHIKELKSVLARIGLSGKYKGVFIDYMQLIGGCQGGNMTAHLDDVNQTIAEFVSSYPIWVCAAAQMNQEGGIRGGRGMAAAADMVLGINKIEYEGVEGSAPYYKSWIEMQATRYTPTIHIGTEEEPAYDFNIGAGPSYKELPRPTLVRNFTQGLRKSTPPESQQYGKR